MGTLAQERVLELMQQGFKQHKAEEDALNQLDGELGAQLPHRA